MLDLWPAGIVCIAAAIAGFDHGRTRRVFAELDGDRPIETEFQADGGDGLGLGVGPCHLHSGGPLYYHAAALIGAERTRRDRCLRTAV